MLRTAYAYNTTATPAASRPAFTPQREPWAPGPGFDGVVREHHKWKGEHQLFAGKHDPLSNFWVFPFKYRGQLYASAEHAYQCMKARCANKPKIEQAIHEAKTPAAAKLLSRHLKMSIDDSIAWDEHRVALMKHILEQKYNQCAPFREALKSGFVYVESTYDDFWACGLMKHMLPKKAKGCTLHVVPRPDKKYPGQNVLGSMLTELSRYHTLDSCLLYTSPSPRDA